MSKTTEQTGRVITEQDLMALRDPDGLWSRETIEALGVPWPPPVGWRSALVGKPLPEAAARLLSSLKEQNRPKDDGVIWERAYRVQRNGMSALIHGPGVDVKAGDQWRQRDDDTAEAWAERLNVAYNAGRRAARLGRRSP